MINLGDIMGFSGLLFVFIGIPLLQALADHLKGQSK